MKHNYGHIEQHNNPGVPEDFFRKLEVPDEKSREEIWSALELRMADKPAGKIVAFKSRGLIYAAAAVIILLAGVVSLLRFYTTTIYSPSGQHLSYNLPDGSTTTLNAETKLSFKPLWWRFSREMTLEGEAFFEVEKGTKFTVISKIGRTEVLGTSFNIYSRNSEYKVTCLTGKVRVISFASAEAVLSPEQAAQINSKGEIAISMEVKASDSHAWISNMFSFTSRPLALVLHEIGRQYDVSITLKAPVDHLYTGYFSKNRSLEETLSLVCTPFGLTFAKISEKEFEIFKN